MVYVCELLETERRSVLTLFKLTLLPAKFIKSLSRLSIIMYTIKIELQDVRIVECPICLGIGMISGRVCYYCGGNGRVTVFVSDHKH